MQSLNHFPLARMEAELVGREYLKSQDCAGIDAIGLVEIAIANSQYQAIAVQNGEWLSRFNIGEIAGYRQCQFLIVVPENKTLVCGQS